MEYLTTKEAAERLGYSSAAVIRKLIERKQITTAKRFGRDWQIPVKELEKIERIRKQAKKKTS